MRQGSVITTSTDCEIDSGAGSVSSAQKLDAVTEEEEFQRFYLQYFFPPSSVGEVRRCQTSLMDRQQLLSRW